MMALPEASVRCVSGRGRSYHAFRMGWFAFAGLCWLLVAYSASHRSLEPDLFGRYSWKAFVFLCLVFSLAVGVTLAGRPAALWRIYEQRRVVGLLLMSSSLSLIAAELGVRFLDPLGISYYEEAGRYHLDKVADADLIYKHRASWRAKYQGVDVRFNELGLRDDTIVPKDDTEFRILILGDSVTFGWGVERERTFASRLQAVLASQLNRPVRVINSGVGGYNTVQEAMYLKKHGLSLNPDLVLLVYVPNDVEENRGPFDPWSGRSLAGKTPPEVFNLVIGKSWLYRFAVHAYEYGRLGANQAASSGSNENSEGWKGSMRALREIVQVCDSQNIPLRVFFFRWQRNDPNSTLLEGVKEAAAPVSVIDMNEWFEGTELNNYLNSRVDSHPNANGHKVIADHMAKHLLEYHPLQRLRAERAG